jgi:hypothetical protein
LPHSRKKIVQAVCHPLGSGQGFAIVLGSQPTLDMIDLSVRRTVAARNNSFYSAERDKLVAEDRDTTRSDAVRVFAASDLNPHTLWPRLPGFAQACSRRKLSG